MGPKQGQLLQVRINLGKWQWRGVPEIEPHHRMVQCHTQNTHWGLIPQKKCSGHILQLQLTEMRVLWMFIWAAFKSHMEWTFYSLNCFSHLIYHKLAHMKIWQNLTLKNIERQRLYLFFSIRIRVDITECIKNIDMLSVFF